MASDRVHIYFKQLGWRFVLGLPLSGRRKTNARFFQRGTRVLSTIERAPAVRGWYEPTSAGHWVFDKLRDKGLPLDPATGHGFVTGFAWRSGFETMVFRWSVLVWTVVFPVQTMVIGPQTMVSILLTVVCLGLGAVFVGQRRSRIRRTSERTEAALRDQLRDQLRTHHPRVTVTSDHGEVRSVAVKVPVDVPLTAESRKRIVDLVSAVAPHLDKPYWPELQSTRNVVFGVAPTPPRLVTYAEMREIMLASPEGVVILGLDAGREVVSHDLNTDPHILMSASTGRGKSKTYANLLAQFLEWGSSVEIADVKQVSLHEFRRARGVTIHTTVESIEDALNLFEQEMMERYDVLKANDVEEWQPILSNWQRKFFMIEELNALFSLEAQRYGSKTNIPTFNTMGRVLSMARQVKMHVTVAGQKLDGRVLPNGIGENFGCRLFSNPTPSTWRALGEGKKPAGSRTTGRTVKLNGGEIEVYQATLTHHAEAIAHAATPRKAWSLTDLGQTSASSLHTTPVDLGQRQSGVTVREIAEMTGKTLEGARTAAKRGEFGPSIGKGARGADLYRAPTYDCREVVQDVD